MMTLRTIKKEDNETLAKLIRNVFDEHQAPHSGTVYSDPTTDDLYSLFQTPQSALWVAELANNIVGSCGIYPTGGLPEGCAELVKFYLSPDARGQGVGRALMEKSIHTAKELGYSTIYLESLPEFSNAVSIYEKQGFVRLAAPMGNSGHPTCNIWMLKRL